MYRHRELLTSLLASAMLTTSLLPSDGDAIQASVIDPATAGRLLGAAFTRMPDRGWAMPDSAAFTAAARPVAPIFAVSLSNSNSTDPIITRARLQECHDRALRNPKHSTIGEGIAVPLGLTPSGALVAKQIGEKTASGHHSFAAPVTDIGKILIIVVKDATVYMYVSDMDGKLIAAGSITNKAFTPMTVEAAASGFKDELLFWRNAVLHPSPPSNA